MIPLRFFWLFDAGVVTLSFFFSYNALPYFSLIFSPDGLIPPAVLTTFSLPLYWIPRLPPLSDVIWIPFAVSPITLILLGAFGNHGSLLVQTRTQILLGCLAAPFGGLSVLALSLFALKDPNWSRLFIFLFGLMSAVGLAAYRLAARTYVTRRYRAGYYAKNVVIIGPLNSVRWMVDFFGKNVSGAAYKLFGFFNAGEERLTAPMGIEALGDVQDLGDVLIHRPIHEVVAIHPEAKSDWLKGVVRDCDYFGVTLRVVPEALLAEENRFLQIVYPSTALHLPAVVFAPRNYESEAQFFKRMVDIVVSLFMLILLSPLFLVIAIAIKLCTPSLPVFYPWRVVGYKGKHFTGYKFTTMVADADAKKADLMALNEMTGPVFKIKNDPRVTPLGRMLRKYSLNELPQFWSVLKGDMSLVGPRPAGPHELERYEMWHKRKLSVMPGITCLWQVRGRNAISDFDDWVKMDLEYIDNWSLWLDFKILIRTAWVVMVGTGS